MAMGAQRAGFPSQGSSVKGASSAVSSAAPLRASEPAASLAREEEFEEISLVDIVRVLHKRRVALIVTLVLALVAGGAITFITTPEYEASTTVIPLSHQSIIKSWLESRQAATFAVDQVGEPLYPTLFPDRWDASSRSWIGPAPSADEQARALREHVEVSSQSSTTNRNEVVLVLSVTLPDAMLARDVAQAYKDSLEQLRPQLEEITRAQLFNQYYDGSNAQEAQARAEVAAREQNYWIAFDDPAVPDDPVKPKPVLNMALGGVLGLMLGVFLVFGLEWVSKYKAEFARVEAPPK